MVIRLQDEDELTLANSSAGSFDIAFTSALHAVEELAERTKQMAVAYLQRRGLCVFFREITDGPGTGLRARSLSDKILHEISNRSNIGARIRDRRIIKVDGSIWRNRITKPHSLSPDRTMSW